MKNIEIQTIDVHELKRRCDANPDLCLIDVREDHEWQQLHIPNAMLIPKDILSSVIEHRVPDQNCPVYLHCRSGVRSLYAAEALAGMGYKDVYSIDGGIIEWARAGYPVAS